MALLIEVLPANDRGASISQSPKLARKVVPDQCPVDHDICMPVVAHSIKKHTQYAGWGRK
jgi:hypothetical protein